MKTTNNQKIKASNLIDNFNLQWSVRFLVLSFFLSVGFSLLSDTFVSSSSLLIALIIIFVLMFLGVFSDMCGVAITSCNLERFEYLCKQQVKYAREATILVKNSDKISVICCDIIGDICSILCGACGTSIVYKIIVNGVGTEYLVLVSSLVSGLIACITIFFKSLEKRLAVTKNEEITLFIARCIKRFFKINKVEV